MAMHDHFQVSAALLAENEGNIKGYIEASRNDVLILGGYVEYLASPLRSKS